MGARVSPFWRAGSMKDNPWLSHRAHTSIRATHLISSFVIGNVIRKKTNTWNSLHQNRTFEPPFARSNSLAWQKCLKTSVPLVLYIVSRQAQNMMYRPHDNYNLNASQIRVWKKGMSVRSEDSKKKRVLLLYEEAADYDNIDLQPWNVPTSLRLFPTTNACCNFQNFWHIIFSAFKCFGNPWIYSPRLSL